jgi:hypothetical protein
MRKELADLLDAYLLDWKSLADCADWLASLDWDDPEFDQDNRNLVGRLELLTTEVMEGLRLEPEFREEAVSIVNSFAERNAFSYIFSMYTQPSNAVPEYRISTSSTNSASVRSEVGQISYRSPQREPV